MSTVYAVAYNGLAALAMLAHLIVNGLFTLIELNMRSDAGTDLPMSILRVFVLVSWFGLAWFGLRAWARRSWLVVVVPIVSFLILLGVNGIGSNLIDWYFPYGV